MDLPQIEKLLISSETSLRKALEVIDKNAQGIAFVVDENSQLVGTITDGDIRRAFLKNLDLDTEVSSAMSTNFVSRPVKTPLKELLKLINHKIRHIPLVDENNRPLDYVSLRKLHGIHVVEPLLNGNEFAYVADCIRTNWISSQGTYVQRFEEMFSKHCNMPYALAVSSGTVGLHLALETLGIGVGDEVIVPDFTFAASINAVIYTGATPVIVDVTPETWTMDPDAVKKAISPKTKAIMPVHLYGHPCHMDELLEIARKFNLFVVEDCAEALGSLYRGRPVGSLGDAAVFSFFGNKTITTGEGGMVLFKNKNFYERANILRDHGMSKERRYWHLEVGYNYRMTNMQAAVGVAQMERIEKFVSAKQRLGEFYNKFFREIEGVTPPPQSEWATNSYWIYTVLINENSRIQRDELMKKLLLNGIETRAVFFPLHKMPPYRKFAGAAGFPVTEDLSRKGISLPSSVSITNADLQSIRHSIETIYNVKNLIKST